MTTVSVKLPKTLADQLEKQAELRGISKSALLRESLARELSKEAKQDETLSVFDLVRDDLGCLRSGLHDLSTNPEHLSGFGQ